MEKVESHFWCDPSFETELDQAKLTLFLRTGERMKFGGVRRQQEEAIACLQLVSYPAPILFIFPYPRPLHNMAVLDHNKKPCTRGEERGSQTKVE